MSNLREILDMVRDKMGPDDCATICRSGNQGACKHNCPGPGENGSVCYELDGADPRPTEEIAAEVEAIVHTKN